MNLPEDKNIPKEFKTAQRDTSTISSLERLNDPSGYQPDPGLQDAVQVALRLGLPLLLTGEPGSGKTRLAYWLAWSLSMTPPLKFETKTSSTARDLFYTYDTLGRFHAAQTNQGSQKNQDYITFNALGLAILLANEKNTIANLLNYDEKTLADRFDEWMFVESSSRSKAKPTVEDAIAMTPRRSIVLIDEIDKAPRDFPNDILNELEMMYFRIHEMANLRISAPLTYRPIVILTSNSEKHLPEPFLRRCAYYHLSFPDGERLRQIIDARIEGFAGARSKLLTDALDYFHILRNSTSGLDKKPGTAELLLWLHEIKTRANHNVDTSLRETPSHIEKTLSILVKTENDYLQAIELLANWASGNSPR